MSDNEMQKNILMAGFPGTGKSTFLAAFWQLVETQSDIVDGSLRLYNKAPPERAYLNAIRDEWANYKPITRNKSDEIKEAYMLLSDGGKSAIRLSFPDTSGEIYIAIVENRTWGSQYHRLISAADRLILFINEDITAGTPTISEVGDTSGHSPASQTGSESSEKEWNTGLVAKQVQYIDLLQLLLGSYAGKPMKKVSIIISAWDNHTVEGRDPDNWLNYHAPMLYQFIKANEDKVQFQVFGISAQGDEYDDGQKTDELAEKPLSERPLIIGCNNSNINAHDITYPVRWLFE